MSSLTDGREAGFLWIDNATLVYIGEHIGPYGISVYAAIAMHTQGRGRQAFPGKKRIATICGCSRRKVQETLRELEEVGVLETDVSGAPGGRNSYTLLDAPAPEKTEKEEEGGHSIPRGGAQHSPGGGTAFPLTIPKKQNPRTRGGAPPENPILPLPLYPQKPSLTQTHLPQLGPISRPKEL